MDAAAARRQSFAVALAAVMGLAGFGLAGCGGPLFGSASNSPQEPPPQKVAEAPVAKVAINSIVGPPDALGKQLHQEFASALEQQRVGVARQKDDRADFNLRPYILAAKEKSGTKVSYVLDVSDPSGKRVNRFAGEEMIAASPSPDPWASITPAVAQQVAAKATGAFIAWLPNARPMVADAAAPPAGVGVPKGEAKAPRAVTKKKAVSSTETTGSILKDGIPIAFVPKVTGAPGDGNVSLTAAVQRELQVKGIALADRPGAEAYRVEGFVTLGAAREGKQPIHIEWVVKDAHGEKKGTVSQKNDITEGLLDKEWGETADLAAKAAVKGILKLLPPAQRG